jgi:hypothetical protein
VGLVVLGGLLESSLEGSNLSLKVLVIFVFLSALLLENFVFCSQLLVLRGFLKGSSQFLVIGGQLLIFLLKLLLLVIYPIDLSR